VCLCGHARAEHILGEVPCSCAYRDDGTPPLFDCDCDGFELTEPAHLFHDGTDLSCGLCRALGEAVAVADLPRFVHAVKLRDLTGRHLRTSLRLHTTKHGRATLFVEVRHA
jgi:hypothetical protein